MFIERRAHFILFSVFIINVSSFVLFLSQGNVCECHTFHYYTHIRYFSFCVSSLHGFLLYPGTVFVFFFFFCLLFLSSNLNLFNLFWFFIHVLNDLIFLLFFCFSFIKSQFFFSFFFCLLYFFIHLFALPPTTCTTNENK